MSVAGSPRRSRLAAPHVSSRYAGLQSPNPEDFTPLPSVSERLARLHPSRELLEYYHKKIAAFDEEQEDLLKRLERYKETYDDQCKLQWEVRQLEKEISKLQKALSDMQVYLFQEREHVLRLHSENDRLKISQRKSRSLMEVQILIVCHQFELEVLTEADSGGLTLAGCQVPIKTLYHSPAPLDREEKIKPKAHGSRLLFCKGQQSHKNEKMLLAQVQALQAQIEEQTQLSKEQVEALLEDRRIHMEEAEVQHQRDQETIKAMTEKLQKTQTLLYESTRDFLQLKFEARANEKAWMAEKDCLLRQLGKDVDHLVFSSESGKKKRRGTKKMLQADDGASKLQSREVKSLQEKLMQEQHLSHMYRQQCVTLEGELARIREELDAGRELFKERSEKMGKRLKLMTQRCEALEKRRNMEVEGFKNDVKQLQQKLKDVEKQMYKVAVNLGPDQDLAILREVRHGNRLTRKIQGELKDLKAKIYCLENELRIC
ncbi:Coiled-coil domain-containing protein 77 [Willisornis vidua]|uniref:Coiled-coil domain-containing protein 77 n=1 Tax=Willisornis vidua TaxID=1566151 RepID=A0ABQ9DG51_9PASS|nr:Coiled-coil domain-containing protein 77 [Willisornis vidua]